MRVLYNGKEVSHSVAKAMSDNFSVQFSQSINVVIVQWPESVIIQVSGQINFSEALFIFFPPHMSISF